MDTNTRAFVELINRREEADTNLRKEMFTTVLQNFFTGSGSVSDDVLKLEILAYNFHQSLDLSPVFQDVLRRIEPPSTISGQAQLSRLTRLAREVVFKQVEALRYGVGATKEGTIDFLGLDEHPEGVVLFDETLTLRPYEANATAPPQPRRFRVEVLDKSVERKELLVRLVAWPPGERVGDSEVDAQFTLGFFDFPGIDNTRLSNGERCALVLQEMHDEWAQVQLVVFPANRAGLKDSMYVEDFVREMLKVRDQQ
jgi:hypothetical protein